MLTVTRRELWPGVNLTAVQTAKFKSGMMGVSFLTPLDRETAAMNALIPMVLRRGTRCHPSLAQINAELDRLYGGSIEPVTYKEGEIQCTGFLASILDDAYTLDAETVLEPAAALLGELLLDPYTQDGLFCSDYIRSEKQNLIDQIRSVVNEKRQYSVRRLVEEMCRDEAFGIGRWGDETDAERITPEGLWRQYQTLCTEARVELYYCGSATPDRVSDAYTRAFSALLRGEKAALPNCEVRGTAGEVRTVEERMDVIQGKLALGFRTGGITLCSPEYPALLMLNALYGGTTTSKLFMNVREKLSLCYFASSMLSKAKGLMIVSSGIEFRNAQRAKDEILTQLRACQNGEIEDWELDAARGTLISAMEKVADSQGQLESYWRTQGVTGTGVPPERLAAQLREVTREQVVAMAKRIKLDTVYFLKGVEA